MANKKDQILAAAISCALKRGYRCITRDEVSTIVGSCSSLINWYFPTMADLKTAVIQTAIDREILEIIAQGLSVGDSLTENLPNELKQKVSNFLTN
jgi:AcrR family transcriptional regulator